VKELRKRNSRGTVYDALAPLLGHGVLDEIGAIERQAGLLNPAIEAALKFNKAIKLTAIAL
jgi:hypothetical protein